MIYLNNAATSWPKAPGVAEAVRNALEQPPFHPGRTGAFADDVITKCRKQIAALLAVDDPNRIILIMNSTHALNIALLGLGETAKYKIITTVSDHNSVLRPLHHLKQRYGTEIAVIGLDSSGSLDKEAFLQELTNYPSLVVINHASNVTGRINDVQDLFDKAKQFGAITLLDASQTLGHITVHPDELYADIVAFTGHKGLRGPPGTGGLYIAPHIELEQIIVGGTGVRSDLMLHPPEMPMRLEAGTPNMPGIAGLSTALDWLHTEGKRFQQREHKIGEYLRHKLKQIPKVTIFDDTENAQRVGIVSFKIDGWQVEETGYILAQSFGVTCRTGLHCAPLIHQAIGSAPEGTVRFSVSGFTTNEEIDTAIAAVKQLAS